MISRRWLQVFAPIFLSLLLFTTACASSKPSPYSQVQKDTTRRNAPAAVAKTAEQGSTFNQFFPGTVRGYEVVPAQEKKGFAEYKVNKDGKTIAMLSINDTTGTPAALKYNDSTAKVAGYPTAEQGTTATGLLINDRYQVKVLSRDPAFTSKDRIAWLQKFDLIGLAKLEPASVKVVTSPKASTPLPKAESPKLPVPGEAIGSSKGSISIPRLPRVLSPQPAG